MIYIYDNIAKKVHIFPTISAAARVLKVDRSTVYYRLTHDIDHLVFRKYNEDSLKESQIFKNFI